VTLAPMLVINTFHFIHCSKFGRRRRVRTHPRRERRWKGPSHCCRKQGSKCARSTWKLGNQVSNKTAAVARDLVISVPLFQCCPAEGRHSVNE